MNHKMIERGGMILDCKKFLEDKSLRRCEGRWRSFEGRGNNNPSKLNIETSIIRTF